MIYICLLKDYPEAISELVQIWRKTLGQGWLSHIDSAQIKEWMNDWLNDEKLPLALVARENNKLVGMCSLQMNDGIRPDLFPWLGDVCVDPEYQNQGVGKLLVRAAIEKVREMGFESLYLFIFEESLVEYYQKLGWRKIGADEYEGHAVIVMELKINEL